MKYMPSVEGSRVPNIEDHRYTIAGPVDEWSAPSNVFGPRSRHTWVAFLDLSML